MGLRLLFGTLVCAIAAVAGCNADETFQCVSDAQCGGGGVCESVNYCSFPDADCATGRRYGQESANGIAGQCVPVEDGTSGSGTDSATGSGGGSNGTGTSPTGTVPSVTESGPIPPATSGPSSTGELETEGESVDASSMSNGSTGGESDSMTSGSTMGETSDGTTGGMSTCDEDEEGCFDCFGCAGADPNACGDAFDACEDTPGCDEVLGCFSSCIGFGICYECCTGVAQAVVDLALTAAQCQESTCPVNCGSAPDVVCDG